MNFQTAFLKVQPLTDDINRRGLGAEVRGLCHHMVQKATRGEKERDPKVCLVVREDDNVVQIMVNVLARPGDKWPEDAGPLDMPHLANEKKNP